MTATSSSNWSFAPQASAYVTSPQGSTKRLRPGSSPFRRMQEGRSVQDQYDEDAEEEEEEAGDDLSTAASGRWHIRTTSDDASAHPPPRKRPHLDEALVGQGFADLSLQQRRQQRIRLRTKARSPSTSGPYPTLLAPPASPVLAEPPASPTAPPCSPDQPSAPFPLSLGQPALQRDASKSSISMSMQSVSDDSPAQNYHAEQPTHVDEPEVEMRERRGPSSWEYAKDKIWVESLDSSSSDEAADSTTSPTTEVDEVTLDGVDSSGSGAFGSGNMDHASFILNPELISKLEDEAKKRLLQQQQQQQATKAKRLFTKPRLFKTPRFGFGFNHDGNSSGRSSRSSTGGSTTPAENDQPSADGKHALILWRSPEQVLQQQQQPHSEQTTPRQPLLDFGALAAAAAASKQEKAYDFYASHGQLRTETMDAAEPMELD